MLTRSTFLKIKDGTRLTTPFAHNQLPPSCRSTLRGLFKSEWNVCNVDITVLKARSKTTQHHQEVVKYGPYMKIALRSLRHLQIDSTNTMAKRAHRPWCIFPKNSQATCKCTELFGAVASAATCDGPNVSQLDTAQHPTAFDMIKWWKKVRSPRFSNSNPFQLPFHVLKQPGVTFTKATFFLLRKNRWSGYIYELQHGGVCIKENWHLHIRMLGRSILANDPATQS